MKFHSKNDEVLFLGTITPDKAYMFKNDLKTGLSIVWNTANTARFVIDGKKLEFKKNCILFLTEFHQIEAVEFKILQVIQFNKAFYCLEKHDDEVGCKGILFFGASDIPKIQIPVDKLGQFNLLWEMFLMEMDEMDSLKKDMLRVMLKRFLIICLRIYKMQQLHISVDGHNIGVIREFNYLVEQHFRTLTKVKDYAKLLHKSPKTLANVFKKYIDKTPLQIINFRRLLEARRLLNYTEATIEEISDELNFKDAPSFSHFFSKREGTSPSAFRKHLMSK